MIPVVFDLDGTLIDSLPNVTDAANAMLADFGMPPLERGIVAGFVGWGEQVFIDKLIAHTRIAVARADVLETFIGHYKTAGRKTRLMPGAEAAVGWLRSQGVPLGLCTNKPRAPLLPVLETTGMSEWFDVVVAGDDLSTRKPDPAPLRHVIAELGAERGLYVGDSLIDAQTARAAGIPFALFTEGIRTQPVEDVPYDAAFADFSELDAIYERFR